MITPYTEIIDSLRAATKEHPDLQDTIDLCCRIMEIQQSAEIPDVDVALTPEEARARLQQGNPLVSPDELEVDPAALTGLAMQIAFSVAEQRRERVKQLAEIHAWLHSRRERMKTVAVTYLRSAGIPNGDSGIDAGLLTFVVHNALQPFLRARAAALDHFVDSATWYRGYCPICGGEPDMAALEKRGGRRRLLCSRCDFEWAYKRLGCAFCGNDDPSQLAFYPSDDNLYRLAVCEQCRRYLKTVDLRESTRELPLAAERVLTAGMDVAAKEMGYLATRPV